MTQESEKLAYPLSWPLGYKRTQWRKHSIFKQTMDASQRFLRDEVKRLGGQDLVVSTNLPVRNDGAIYAAYLDKLIDDPGVAIFFKYKGKPITVCCDQYKRVWENIYALGRGIEALRGMERWGVSEFLERAFTGFAALPPAGGTRTWFDILECSEKADAATIRQAYRNQVKRYHSDNPATGDGEKFIQVQRAFDEAKQKGLVNG